MVAVRVEGPDALIREQMKTRQFKRHDAVWIAASGKRYVYPNKGASYLAPGEPHALTRTLRLTPKGDREAFIQSLERILGHPLP